MIDGKYKNFWGSLVWEIKLNTTPDLSKVDVIFHNKRTRLENIFEVEGLCRCAKLMMKVAEAFEIQIFPRRLASWLEDYFRKEELLTKKVDNQTIVECLKDKSTDKIRAKVKKMMIADKAFTEAIEYDTKDLIIDVSELYSSEKPRMQAFDAKQNVMDIHATSHEFNTITIETTCSVDGQKQVSTETMSLQKDEITGQLTSNIRVENTFDKPMNDFTLLETISSHIRLTSLTGRLLNTADNKLVSEFQPVSIDVKDDTLIIQWQIETLQPTQVLEIRHEFNPTAHLVIHDSSGRKYLHSHEIKPQDDYFVTTVPQLNDCISETPNQVRSIVPLRFRVNQGFSDQEIQAVQLDFGNQKRIYHWSEPAITSNTVPIELKLEYISQKALEEELQQQKLEEKEKEPEKTEQSQNVVNAELEEDESEPGREADDDKQKQAYLAQLTQLEQKYNQDKIDALEYRDAALPIYSELLRLEGLENEERLNYTIKRDKIIQQAMEIEEQRLVEEIAEKQKRSLQKFKARSFATLSESEKIDHLLSKTELDLSPGSIAVLDTHKEILELETTLEPTSLPLYLIVSFPEGDRFKAKLKNPSGATATYLNIVWDPNQPTRLWKLPVTSTQSGTWRLEAEFVKSSDHRTYTFEIKP